ncbi:hypothetical protein Pint_10646 [Pistacia integerrima]|uniref:Uncharacterized protein n=1 Tax=Pistacia integerrima TaxID=434235 RepID=A0ACC0XHM4_9ROSI|nr:hypothetical protein Pint_10646 [Pistacia integerrima]
MATTVSFVFLRLLLCAYLLSLCLLCSLKNGYAFGEREYIETQEVKNDENHYYHHNSHTIQLNSLLQSPVCDPSTKASERKSSLKVVHRHGPCFKQNGDEANSPSHAEILLQDQARVNSIHSKLSKKSRQVDRKDAGGSTLPAKDGSSMGSGNYIITVGLGTPKRSLSLIFDTGSDVTWTQCKPCVRYCYPQNDPIYDPSASKTYTNVSCKSDMCDELESATGNSLGCASSTCLYGIRYGDNSFSIGIFGTDTLTITSADVFKNFYFGCGQNNRGLFGKTAGLLGLGRNAVSVVSQTATKYKQFFSYCLPSSSSSTGHLTFGNSGGPSKSVKFTPLSAVTKDTSFYGLDIVGLSVGGKKLSISKSVFSNGAIIDSGTVITRLPPAAYSPLSTAFRKLMAAYPTAPALSILDTCYDFSNYTSIEVPKISFFFNGGVEVSIDVTGILYANSVSQVCLAIAANSDASDVAIFGNTQQKTMEVVYDGARGRVGFAPKGCS